MPSPFKTTRRIQFRDTDAAGIMHFSVFFTYMEEAEHELLQHLGLSVVMRDEQGIISWPRVSARCDFVGAVRFEELVDIEVGVRRMGRKSVTYGVRFTRDGQAIAQGEVTAVCCRIDPGSPPHSIPIPAAIAERLADYLVEADDDEDARTE